MLIYKLYEDDNILTKGNSTTLREASFELDHVSRTQQATEMLKVRLK